MFYEYIKTSSLDSVSYFSSNFLYICYMNCEIYHQDNNDDDKDYHINVIILDKATYT